MELITSLHAVSGLVVALTGLLQLVMKKGGIYHAIIGFTYLSAWLIVLVTGMKIGSWLISLFGLLGFYAAITGWRFANRRSARPKKLEKVIYWTGGIFALITLIWGITLLVQGGSTMSYVATFFGLIFIWISGNDIRRYVVKKDYYSKKDGRKHWVFQHLIRMYISFIAALTAFSVINELFANNLMNWLAPTFVGTAVIFYSAHQQRKKFAAKEDH